MAQRRIAAGLILTLMSFPAYAQPSRSADGCALLDRLVRDSVYAAATQSDVNRPQHRAGRRGQAGMARGIGSRQTCSKTAEVASRAFTEAISGLVTQITWNAPRPGYGGSVCLSVDPGECSPSFNPLQAPVPGDRRLFVDDAWQAVQSAIASQMPFGTASGVSSFTAESLAAALSSHLNAAVDGPLSPVLQNGWTVVVFRTGPGGLE